MNEHLALTPTVAIFRKRLLSYSETFIADQGQMLPRYRPLYCGYRHDDSGSHMIDASARLLLQEHSAVPALSKFLLRRGLPGANAWVRAIADYSPALIHAHFFNDGVDAIRLGRRLQLPTVTTVHGHDIPQHDTAGSRSARRF